MLTFVLLTVLFWKQWNNLSHLLMSEIVHMDPIKRYGAVLNAEDIDWVPFDFKAKIVKVKVRLIACMHILFCSVLNRLFNQLCLMIIHNFIPI